MTMLVESQVLVRKPRYKIYVAGTELPHPIDIRVTRGMDQELGSADITYPFPVPPFVGYWSKISILMAATKPSTDPTVPYQGLVERFVGYVADFQESLWPGAVTIHCEDILVIAKNTYTPTEMDLTGETDITAIKRILGPAVPPTGGCGLRVFGPFEGHGKLLTDEDDTQLFWEEDQTALQQIQQIDQTSMGYRTFCTPGGMVMRKFLNTDPNTQEVAFSFSEGLDLLEGSASSEVISPINEIQVTGFDLDYEASLPIDEDAFYWMRNRYWQRWLWLRSTGGSGVLDAQEVAAWILSQLSKRLYKITFSTHLDRLFLGMEVVHVVSRRLNCNQNFWVQSVQEEIDSTGQYTQTLTCVGELIREVQRPIVTPPVIPPPEIIPGQPITIPAPDAPVAPAVNDITVAWTVVAIERELATPAAVAGNEGFVYTVTFADQSTSRQGTITARLWTAIPGGVITVATGDGPTFTTTYSDLSTAQLTLHVTDSNGQEAEVTDDVDLSSTPVSARKLYACTDTTYEAFDGTQWRSRTPVSAPSNVSVVAGGPWWGAGNYVAYSADDLVTAPTEVAALPGGETITAIWKHESTEGDVAVGGDAGHVAISHDKGATWTLTTSPGSKVNFIIVSIHDPTEIHVVTPEGWKKSQNSGQTWALVRAGSFAYLELSHSRNIVVTTAGQLQKGEDGTPFTGNTSPIVAATAHIRQDKFYAIAEDGTTWYTDTEGSFALVAGEPIPAGEPYTAGAYRDGLLVDLVYFAAQDGGLFKTLDGFRTPEGYMRLRANGELTP